MVNKNILLIIVGLLLLSTLTSARRLHFEGDTPSAASTEGVDAKPADGAKPAEGASGKSAEGSTGKPAEESASKLTEKPAERGDKPAPSAGGDGAKISSVEFCGCEGAIAVSGDKLILNTSASSIQKGEFSLPSVNWTNFRAPPSACKDGYYKKTVDGVCEPADAKLIQDLDAPNLISSEPIPSLRKKQQAFFRAHPTFRPIYCNDNIPYVSKSLQCVSCEAPKQYWSLDQLECVACPQGQVYSDQEKKCIPKPAEKTPLTNLDSNSFLTGPGEDLNKYKRAQEEEKSKNPNAYICDINTPYVINGVCLVCPKDTPLFYLPTEKCVKCKTGSYYDSDSLSCIAADPRMSIPIKTPNLLVDPLALSESQSSFYLKHPDFRPIACEIDAPFYNGQRCISCSVPTELFNVASLTCDSCKPDEIYVPRRRACKPINSLLLLNLNAPNLLLPYGVTIEQLKEKQESFINKHPTFTPHKCDTDRPYFNGEVCTSCEEPTPLFNVSSLQCTACPESSKYDADTRQCTMLTKTNRYYTNTKALKYILLCDDTSLDQVKKDIENEKEVARNQPLVILEKCPEETPFSLGGKCIACGGDNPYFDYCLKKCSRCAPGEDFNPETQTCTTDAGGFYTDLSNRFLVVGGNRTFDEVTNEIKSRITKKMIECPKNAPFFDGNSCINCQAPLQYFDLEHNHCVGCFEGTFNSQERKCELEEIVNPLEGKFKEITKTNRLKLQKNITQEVVNPLEGNFKQPPKQQKKVTQEVVNPLEGKFKQTTTYNKWKLQKNVTDQVVDPLEGKLKETTTSNQSKGQNNQTEEVVNPVESKAKETTTSNQSKSQTNVTEEIVNPLEGKSTNQTTSNETKNETQPTDKNETSGETSGQTETSKNTAEETGTGDSNLTKKHTSTHE